MKENYRCCRSLSVVGLTLARILQFRFGNIFILKNPSGNSPQTLNFNPAIFWQMDFSAGFAIRRNEKIIQQDSESIENIDGFRNPSKRKRGQQTFFGGHGI